MRMKTPIQTKWHVITGAPCSGKTSVISWLGRLGYEVLPEMARCLIDRELTQGKTIEQIRGNEGDFQIRVFNESRLRERKMPAEKLVFMDRSLLDSYAFNLICGLNVEPVFKACVSCRYKMIFFMERLPWQKDYARTEDADMAEKIARLLWQGYEKLGYHPISVPLMPAKARAEFILSYLSNEDKGN